MKKILSVLLVSALVLSGCSGKGSIDSKSNGAGSQVTQEAAAAQDRVEIKTDFQAAKPGTVPQLSVQQKTQVDAKLNSALKNIDNALNSIQDVKDIDLGSLDQN